MRIARPTARVAIAGLVLLAGGCGVAAAVSPTTPAAPGTDHVRGTVTAENGSTWTVTTAPDRTVTVTVTPQTAFGTAKAPLAATRFPVGSRVRVAGTRQGETITADRITAPRDKA